jgi:PAS domain S-box-containing protein
LVLTVILLVLAILVATVAFMPMRSRSLDVTPLKLPPVFISTIPPTTRQSLVGLLIALLMLAVFGVSLLFAHVQFPVIPNFTPTVDALLGGMLAITTFILVGQFLRLRTWSMLSVCAGFMFKTLMVILHGLSYPGFLLSTGLNGINTTIWLFVFWRCGFPLFLIVYAQFHRQSPRRQVGFSPGSAIAIALTFTLMLAVGGAALLAQWDDLLPSLTSPEGDRSAFHFGNVGLFLLAIDVIALWALWRAFDSVLELWLMVAVVAIMCSVASFIAETYRYELSFYMSWLFELLSATVILGALMDEMNRLYASLFTIMEEQQLARAAEYRAVVDTATDAIIVIDEVGTMESFNAAAQEMFGYPPSEVIGQNVKMLMPEPYTSAHDQYLSNYLNTGVKKVIGIGREVQARRKDGSVFPVELAVAEWRVGATRRFTGILRDMSERKRIEQQLLQSQKMEAIGQLTGGMAHDFNNILGVVIGNLDMLSERYPPGEAPIELKDAIESSMAGADLVRRLLAFARRQPLLPRAIELQSVIESLLPLVKRIIGDHVVIETYFDPDLLPVKADPAQFENVLLNLIINARDAMPRGGRLEIACRNTVVKGEMAGHYDVPEGQYSTLIVRDSGIGIPAELLPHVVEPFYTTKPPGMGSGLGLSMVFGYAKQSGGVLRIYSEVNQGTEVRVYLPSIPAIMSAESESVIDLDTASLHGNERILLVEDTEKARVMTQRMLLSLGYIVRSARDATEAMLFLDSGEPFDLLFTDIVMPGEMDGVELARLAKLRYPSIRVLFTSGFSRRPAEDVMILQAAYITKPYRKLELASTVRKLFDGRA